MMALFKKFQGIGLPFHLKMLIKMVIGHVVCFQDAQQKHNDVGTARHRN